MFNQGIGQPVKSGQQVKKLESPVMMASVALGRSLEGATKTPSRLVKGAIRTPHGLRNVTTLLDSGADFAKENHLPLEQLENTGTAFDGHEVT